jgi:hypothetical protein
MNSNVFNAVQAAFAKAMLECALMSKSSMPLQVLNHKFFTAEDIDALRAEISDEEGDVTNIDKVFPDLAANATQIDVLNYLVAKHQ